MLGTDLPAPVMLAPVGVQSILHPDGELATARAAAELGIPMVLSTASSHTIEEVAEASGDGPRWYQLYWPNDPDVCASLLDRARKAGYTALVVTLDTWTLAWRPHDLDQAYLPFLRGVGTAIPFSDPVFRAGLAEAPEDDLPMAILRWVQLFTGTDKSWDQLAFLRSHWDGPIVLKGIQHPDDARKAVRVRNGRCRGVQPRRPPGGRRGGVSGRAARRSSRRWGSRSTCCSTPGSVPAPTS